jgi:hypothetical protein
MQNRLAAIFFLVILGLGLGGCSKCGWLWEEGGRACRAETPR